MEEHYIISGHSNGVNSIQKWTSIPHNITLIFYAKQNHTCDITSKIELVGLVDYMKNNSWNFRDQIHTPGNRVSNYIIDFNGHNDAFGISSNKDFTPSSVIVPENSVDLKTILEHISQQNPYVNKIVYAMFCRGDQDSFNIAAASAAQPTEMSVDETDAAISDYFSGGKKQKPISKHKTLHKTIIKNAKKVYKTMKKSSKGRKSRKTRRH
jgi:hypothetical protein